MNRQEEKALEYQNANLNAAPYDAFLDGYQYAKKRLREVLSFELDFNVAEFDDGVTTESLVDKVCMRMEE